MGVTGLGTLSTTNHLLERGYCWPTPRAIQEHRLVLPALLVSTQSHSGFHQQCCRLLHHLKRGRHVALQLFILAPFHGLLSDLREGRGGERGREGGREGGEGGCL